MHLFPSKGQYNVFCRFVLRSALHADMSQEVPEQKADSATSEKLKVTLLGSEWTSSAGGLSTLNRELAIHLSQHPEVEVSFLVPQGACTDEDKRQAQSYGITVFDADKCAGFEPLDWLSFPPQDLTMDVVVGHGVKLGRQGQIIRDKFSTRFPNCKWVQVVHTAPEDLSKYKSYSHPISIGERKHENEVDLCKLADLVVPIGPRLKEAYSSYLQRCARDEDIFTIIPGLFDREFGNLEQSPNENAEFKVLLCGRRDEEDSELKGYNIAVKAFIDHRIKRKRYHLIFVGAPDGKQEEIRKKLLQSAIAEEQLTVRKFVQSRESMKYLLCEVDLVIMPSKSEGFGLVALEALSAGLPILVGSKSGFARAIENIPYGKSWIVDSDDPTKWAEAIEGVRTRHTVRLEEIKLLKESYAKKYSWNEQCVALVQTMRGMVQGIIIIAIIMMMMVVKMMMMLVLIPPLPERGISVIMKQTNII